MNLTATHINYFFTCKRKLWLFSRNIKCEQDSEQVKIGKIHHEDLESNKVEIDNMRFDAMKDGKVFELKKRNSSHKAAHYQVMYYLFKLKEKGIITTGIIKYKENNRLEPVELTPERERTLTTAMREVVEICSLNRPPLLQKTRYCKNCSYCELCFS